LFEQLKGQSLDSSGRLALASIEQLHRTLSETLSLLLDISRLDAGGVSPKSVCFPLQELFTSLVRTYQINAAEVGMEIRVHPTSAIVRSDPAMLNHILSNLVDNAIRHGRPPGLLLGVRRCGEQWSLEVWDTGVGIPPEQQREIFREFVQLDNPGHDSSKGYGLGLSIVDRLARLLSHPLRIASRVGRGTCIKLLVPDGASEFEPPRSFHQALNHSSQNSLQGCLVLLLEDDLAVREITTELLRRWGCGVATASSAEQAMAVTREEEIDLILADYRLNGPLTGADIIARLDQATGRKHPAIILSGDMDGLHEQQEKLDRTHITLPKPISPMALRSALQRALSTRSP
jgi:CheY-like chemotaxis protein